MWLFTPIGFFSVVADRYDKKGNRLMVRARARKDLQNLKKRYCKRLGPIIDNRKDLYTSKSKKTGKTFSYGSDYPFRAFVGRRAFANAMRLIVRDLTYTNFKSQVMKEQGGVREGAYMRVWSVMREAERQGKLDGTYKPPPFKSYGSWYDDSSSTTSRGTSIGGGRQLTFPGRRFDLPESSRRRFDDDDDLPTVFDSRVDDRDDPSDPFYWRDGEGHTSDDDSMDGEGTPLEFDSIEEVMRHFKGNDEILETSQSEDIEVERSDDDEPDS